MKVVGGNYNKMFELKIKHTTALCVHNGKQHEGFKVKSRAARDMTLGKPHGLRFVLLTLMTFSNSNNATHIMSLRQSSHT